MKDKRLQYLTINQLVLLIYFLITTLIFIISIKFGSEGVSVNIIGGGDDGTFYWAQAKNYANGDPWIKTSIYPQILGFFMKITGIQNAYLIRLFNYIGLILLFIFSFKLIDIQYGLIENNIDFHSIHKSKTILILSYLFYVSLQLYTNLSIFRDVWIYALYTLSTYLSIKLLFSKQYKFIFFILLLFSVFMLGEFRKYAMLSFILSTCTYLVYTKFNKYISTKFFLTFMMLAFALYYTFLLDFSVIGMSLNGALNYRQSALDVYSGGSQMWISLKQPNFILFLLNYIHSYIGNLVGPLPWHISGISTLFVFFVESIPMILILIILWNKRKLLTGIQRYILMHGFVWISLIGFSNDNIGTATRLRVVAWILILIVFAFIYSKKYFMKSPK